MREDHFVTCFVSVTRVESCGDLSTHEYDDRRQTKEYAGYSQSLSAFGSPAEGLAFGSKPFLYPIIPSAILFGGFGYACTQSYIGTAAREAAVAADAAAAAL